MEQAVYKKDIIQVKFEGQDKSKSKSSVKSNGVVQQNSAQVFKQIQTLKTTLAQTTQSTKQLDQAISQRQNELNQVSLILKKFTKIKILFLK